jgi:hypothetical protein
MTLKEQKQTRALLNVIEERLDNIEELTAWLIRGNQRFKKGQRVKFSTYADRKGISLRRKGGVQRGTVVEAGDTPFVKILLDGYAKPRSFHHMFFEGVGRSRE